MKVTVSWCKLQNNLSLTFIIPLLDLLGLPGGRYVHGRP